MHNNGKKLVFFVNIFDIQPAFLLPIFKDTDNGLYYAQYTENNKIVGFEEIIIDKYIEKSKIYNVLVDKKYYFGSDTVYAIDYQNGYIFGDRETIISFYLNNSILFLDEDFIISMSKFVQRNNDIIDINKTLDSSIEAKQDLSLVIYDENKYSYDKTLYNYSLYQSRYRYYVLGENKFSLEPTEIDLFNCLYQSPPVLNLWNDKIIEAYTNNDSFYAKVGLNSSFPDDMFKNIEKWKTEILPQAICKIQKKGFKSFYLNINPISTGNAMGYAIVAQDYYLGINYFKLYTHITIKEFNNFVIGLIRDIKSKICFVVEHNILGIINDYNTIEKYIKSGHILFISPPLSKSVYERSNNYR